MAFPLSLFLAALFVPSQVWAQENMLIPSEAGWLGYAVMGLFALAYSMVLAEEKTGLLKSKPVTVAAGLIWILVTAAYSQAGKLEAAPKLLSESLLEFAEMMLFLISAMTYVNAMEDRGLFSSVRYRLTTTRFSLRGLYWIMGLIAFFLSPLTDNLTTALILGTVATTVGHKNKKFITLSCINIVVAANAGGAFSPFGDITTLMVWQKGYVGFWSFFRLFVPALVSWLIPAAIMSLGLTRNLPDKTSDNGTIRKGGLVIGGLFLMTLAMTVSLHQWLHIPPFLGMMTGLGLLKFYGFFLHRSESKRNQEADITKETPFDIFVSLKKIEWDTLMFFYGIMMCVGGLQALGYLTVLSGTLYGEIGATYTHIAVGLISSVLDNIPVMLAVLQMGQDHSLGQWLLVTLTAGIGGSLLSIGSAAGVALMGQAQKSYTFSSHLKWSWAILLGYAAGVGLHLWINQSVF